MIEQVQDAWKDQAACKLLDPELFFPSKFDMAGMAEAKAVCATCPVQHQCLEYGLGEDGGVWGGTSERERMRIRRARRRAGIAIQRRDVDKVVQHRKPDAIVSA